MNFASNIGSEGQEMCICRCCLKKDCIADISIEINKFEKKDLCFNLLKDTFNIQSEEEIPIHTQYICIECMVQLNAASTFKNMILQNEEQYFKYIKRCLNRKDVILKDTGVEVITEDMSLDIKYADDNYGFNDNDSEMLSNVKIENVSNMADEEKLYPTSQYKGKRLKIKTREIDTHQDLTKLLEHRGSGPVLRENSLKLLEHSTACVFQWNQSWYRCFCCKEPFSSIQLLRNHTQKCHTLNDIKKKIIEQQNRLVKVEISILNCKNCDEKLSNLDELKTHLVSHGVHVNEHLLVPFRIDVNLTCQICSEPFNLFRLLNIHMNKHYQKHVCYICGAGFSNLVFLNLHRTRSHRPVYCQKCDVNFEIKSDKKQHDIDVHGVKFERKRRFPCPFCSERFPQENLRVLHLVQKHDMKKPEFPCNFCSKTFITKSLLNNHIKIVHMKERQHECDICHRFFYTKSDVFRHKVTHTGEKNYFCSVCNNPFATKDSLRRHMKRTHD